MKVATMLALQVVTLDALCDPLRVDVHVLAPLVRRANAMP